MVVAERRIAEGSFHGSRLCGRRHSKLAV